MAKVYDPKLVTVTFGTFRITGFGDGTHIACAYNDEEEFKHRTGGDGEGSWTKTADRSGRITLQLKTTSSAQIQLDQFRTLGVTAPCFVRNASDQSSLIGGAEAKVVNRAAKNFGVEEELVEYIIEVLNMSSAAIPA